MTTITINNPIIEAKYTKAELEKVFLYFVQNELKEDSVNLYQIEVSDLDERGKDRLEKIDSLNFVNY